MYESDDASIVNVCGNLIDAICCFFCALAAIFYYVLQVNRCTLRKAQVFHQTLSQRLRLHLKHILLTIGS